MLFALLGDDEPSRQMAMAVLRHSQHDLVAAYETDFDIELSKQSITSVDGRTANAKIDKANAAESQTDQWESLLSGAVADAVIVAGHAGFGMEHQRRVDQLRKLVQAGIPLLISHPACEAIVGFELDMIRRDTGCVMQAFAPGIGHPAIEQMARWFQSPEESPIGIVEELIIERAIEGNDTELVLTQLARDATMLRRLAGPLTKVSAIGTLASESATVNLTVGVGNETAAMIRWSIVGGRPPSRCSGHFSMIGTSGTVVLDVWDEAGRWRLEVDSDPESSTDFADYDCYETQLNRFVDAVGSKQVDPVWIDMARDTEVAEASHRSVQRGRQVELYQDEPTEAGTFKGMMAAGGCLLLMLSLGVLILAAAVEGLRLPFREHFLWRIWPVYLVAPLLLFLLLQSLSIVANQARKSPSEQDAKSPLDE